MDVQTLLTPVGMGKTEHLINELAAELAAHPFTRVWVLLATGRQETAFRQRLIDSSAVAGGACFNVEFFNFYTLYSRLLDMAGNPPRTIDETTRRELLRDVIADERDALKLFAPIAQTAGFVANVAEFIYELKQNRIEPEAFAQSAQDRRDADLARIYGAYQARLQRHNLADREGEGWLALDALDAAPRLAASVDLLLVDGFDQFTQVQADLLARLAERVRRVRITMTHVAGREQTIGRRFAQARERLAGALGDAYSEADLPAAPEDGRHPDLQHLTRNIFRQDAPERAISGGLDFIEAPDAAGEVGAIARRVKRLLLDGVAPDDVMIVLRDWTNYSDYFSAAARRYHLPIAHHYGEPVTRNPAIIALMKVLELSASGLRRRDVIDVLQSPYWTFDSIDASAVAYLEKISLQHQVIRGMAQWDDAIKAGRMADDDDQIAADDQPIAESEAEREALRGHFATIIQAITPPERATIAEYIGWIEALIGADEMPPDDTAEETDNIAETVARPPLQMMRCIRAEDAPEAAINRDLAALEALKACFAAFLVTEDLMSSLGADNPPVTWRDFYAELGRRLESTDIKPRPDRFGRVLVTTAADGRGLPHAHVFITGLSEGVFPAPSPVDPFYLDSERQALRHDGRRLLATQAERRADDGLFYELISTARHTLTLTRPTVQDGKPWLASSLWAAACRPFAEVAAHIAARRVKLAEAVSLNSAITPEETAVAAVSDLSAGADDHQARSALAWLSAQHAALYDNIRTGQQIESSRYKGDIPPAYDGVIQHAPLLPELAAHTDADHHWSASQLNSFGQCAYRFFAARLLNLEALEEPEEGLDVLQRGSLYHAILEAAYTGIREDGLTITPPNTDAALDHLREAAEATFPTAPERFGFRQDALWRYTQEEALRKLERFVRADFGGDLLTEKTFGTMSNRRPFLLEWPFAYRMHAPDGEPIRIRGVIDRIDRCDEGLVVIDYKAGSTAINIKDMTEGRNMQIFVYLQALDDRFPSVAKLGGAFCLIGGRKASGAVILSRHREEIDATADQLTAFVATARRGEFTVTPSRPQDGKCTRYCEFHQLCRHAISRRGE